MRGRETAGQIKAHRKRTAERRRRREFSERWRQHTSTHIRLEKEKVDIRRDIKAALCSGLVLCKGAHGDAADEAVGVLAGGGARVAQQAPVERQQHGALHAARIQLAQQRS